MNRCAAFISANTSECKGHETITPTTHLPAPCAHAAAAAVDPAAAIVDPELHQELEQLLTDNPLLERLDEPLAHSVRLLGDGAISSTSTPTEAAPEPGAPEAPPAEGDSFEGGETEGAASSDNDGEWGDLGRTKTPDDEDSRPQLEASATTLREHLMEQMRLAMLEPRDRALV